VSPAGSDGVDADPNTKQLEAGTGIVMTLRISGTLPVFEKASEYAIRVPEPDVDDDADKTSVKAGVDDGLGVGDAVAVTARLAVAARFVAPWVVVSAPAARVLACVLAAELVTLTLIVHEAFTARLPAESATAPAPAGAAIGAAAARR
jgi:hypothetical protein